MKSRAFTLIEVLIALGVFGFAVIGGLAALNTIMEMASETRFEGVVRQRLEDCVARIEAEPPGEISRVTDLTSPTMKITEECKPEQVIGSNRTILNGFWRVKIRAEWQQAGEPQTLEASFLRYNP